MESASSANEGASRRIFDSILDPCESESESQLGSTRDRATSGRRQESRESVHSILKRLDKGPRGKAFRFSGEWSISNTNFESGACRAQDFQEHVHKRLVTTIPYTSINYIIFSYRRSDVFACNSPSNIGSTNSTVEKIPSVDTCFVRPRGGPIYAATGVPTTRVTHQCARVTPGRRIRAVTARGERYSTRYEPGR